MTLDRDVADLLDNLTPGRQDFASRPLIKAAIALNALAGLVEATPADAPLGRVLEAVLKSLPAAPSAGKELRRLSEWAGRSDDQRLRATSGQFAMQLRELAKALGRMSIGMSIEDIAGVLLSRRQGCLVQFLLNQEDNAAHECDVIADLWPAEQRRKTLSPAARNRLYKLMHDTNLALGRLYPTTHQIKREAGVLRLVRVWEAEQFALTKCGKICFGLGEAE
jgi:hypothetical protein